MKKIISFVWEYSKNYILFWLIYVVLCGVLSAFSMVQPIINGKFIDYLTLKKDSDNKILFFYVGLYIVFFVITAIIGYAVDRIYTMLQFRIGFKINMSATKHVLRVPFSFVYKKNSIYISELINNESCALTSFSLDIIQDMIKNIILIILGFILVIKYMGSMGLIIVLFMPLYYLIYILQRKKLYIESSKINEMDSVYFSKLYGLLSNSKFIKINELSKYFVNKINVLYEGIITQTFNCKNLGWKYNTFEGGVSTGLNIFMVMYLGTLILQGKMTIGEYTIINSYYAIITSSVKYFFSLGKNLQEARVSYDRLDNIMRLKEEENGKEIINKIDKISLDKISFAHGNNVIYDNYSIDLLRGNVYTIIGENGSGKSTLINIIIGLYIEQVQGHIYINDKDMKEIDMRSLRKNNIVLAEQDPFIYEDTLLNNIILDNKNYDKNKLDMLLTHFRLSDVISRLPQGLETMVYEDVINFSGGEKQKISLVRTFLQEKDLIILDEPTNALDMQTKELLKDYIEIIKKDKIIILITHDDYMRMYGDRIINLNKL